MQPNWLERPATRTRLHRLAEAGVIDQPALDRALALAGLLPVRQTWRSFVDRLLLLLGVVFLLAGVIFFFAYNWAFLGRFAKFGLIEVGLLLAAGVAWHQGVERLTGQAATLAAALLLGAFLAVFGQTYQTGADAYQLFGTWALLATPWVLLARFQPLWLLWLALLNATLLLWALQTWEPRNLAVCYLLAFLLDSAALAGWELSARRGIGGLGGDWPRGFLTVGALFFVVVGNGIFTFDDRIEWAGVGWSLATLLHLGFVGFCLSFYRRRRFDALVLAASLFSVIVVVTMWLIELVPFEGKWALLIGLAVVAETAGAAAWLRAVAAKEKP